MLLQKMNDRRLIMVAILVALAILSATVFANVFSSPGFHRTTIRTLDDQKSTATTLSIAVTAASTTLSLLPDDTAAPIANELADLTTPLFIIVCIIYLEKFLLTVFAWLAFAFLFPACCILLCVYIYKRSEQLLGYVKKLIALALALIMIIPFSTHITVKIQDTFAESIDIAFSEIDGFSDESLTEDEEATNAFVKFFSNLKDDVVQLVETSKNMLGVFSDAIAVMLITSCAMPIITAALFIMVIKYVFSLNIPAGRLAKQVAAAKKNRRQMMETESE